MEHIPYIAVSNKIQQTNNRIYMNLRITTYDYVGRATVTFQWVDCFHRLVEQLLERISLGGKVHLQTESRIKYTIGSWTKEIEVI